MRRETTTWYLQMLERAQFRPATQRNDLDVRHLSAPPPEFVKYLWTAVGGPWSWFDRSSWTDDDWRELVGRPNVHIWAGYVDGTPIGYFELRNDERNNVEILYFGLLPEFIGQGFGGQLLNEAVTEAWDMGATRVWVHTCDADGPHALDNYKARGFEQYAVKVEVEEVPDR